MGRVDENMRYSVNQPKCLLARAVDDESVFLERFARGENRAAVGRSIFDSQDPGSQAAVFREWIVTLQIPFFEVLRECKSVAP